MKQSLLFLFVILGSFAIGSLSFAKTRIVFLEQYDHKGQRIEYEPGSRFVHTAIQFDDIGDQWLNAYPNEGVALVSWDDLQKRGVVGAIVEIPQELHYSQVAPYMGIPFDFWYSWSDENMYCSELIGKLLKVPTHPMQFNKKVWPKNYWHLEGSPGISPDSLWRWAKEQAI